MVTPVSPGMPEEPIRFVDVTSVPPARSVDIKALSSTMGNKAANLYQLQVIAHEANIEVPPFLSLSHSVIEEAILSGYPEFHKDYRAFQKSLGSPPVLTSEGRALLKTIRKKIQSQPFISQEMRGWIASRGLEYIAVRSTGREDSDKKSNAGAYLTKLYVAKDERVVSENIGEVVASYFSEESVLQRIASGDETLVNDPPFVPILLQEMVGEPVHVEWDDQHIPRSGVMFVKPDVSEISVGLGHNAGIVSSSVTTDTCRFSMTGGVRQVVREKKTRFRGQSDEKGVITCVPVSCSEKLGKSPALSLKMAYRMQEVAKKIYAIYQRPMDVEFTIIGNQIYLLQARPLVISEQHPSYLETIEGGLKGETLVAGNSKVALIERQEELIIADTIEDAYKAYVKHPESVKAIVIREEAPRTSHRAVFFTGEGIPVVIFDGEVERPCLLDPQQGIIAQRGTIREGNICYPMPLQYSLQEVPFNKKRVETLKTRLEKAGGSKYLYLYHKIMKRELTPMTRLELITILENIIDILEQEKDSPPLYVERLIEACLYQSGRGIIGGTSLLRVTEDIKSHTIAMRVLQSPLTDTMLLDAPLVKVGRQFLREGNQKNWEAFLPTIPAEKRERIRNLFVRIDKLGALTEFVNVHVTFDVNALERLAIELEPELDRLEQNISMQQIMQAYKKCPQSAKLLYIQRARALIHEYDEKIKVCIGSTEYPTNVAKVQAFLRMLHVYREMMLEVLALDPRFNSMSSESLASWYLDKVKLPASLEGITEAQATEMLKMSPDFDVSLNTWSNVREITYTESEPTPASTLADQFTLIHQSMEELLAELAVKQGLSTEMLPVALSNYIHSLREGRLQKIQMHGSTIEVEIFFPLREHGAQMTLTFDQTTGMVSTRFSMYGGNESGRWNLLQALAIDTGEFLPEFTVRKSSVDHASLRLEFVPSQLKELDLLRANAFYEALLEGSYSFASIPQTIVLNVLVPPEEQTKELVLEVVKKHWDVLSYAHEDFQRDPEIIEIALKQDPMALSVVPLDMQTKEMVLHAVRRNGSSLYYANADLKKDPEICREAVLNHPQAFKFVPKEVQTKEMLLSIVEQYPGALKYAAQEFHTKDVVLECVRKNGLCLEHVHGNLKRDREIIALALAQNPMALEHVPVDLCVEEMALECVERNGLCLNVAHRFRTNPKVIEAALQQNPRALAYVQYSLQTKEMVLSAILRGEKNRSYIAPHLLNDPDILAALGASEV